MRVHYEGRSRWAAKMAKGVFGVVLVAAMSSPGAWAQTETKPATTSNTVSTFYLTNISQANEAAEILTALRNLLAPTVKIYMVAGQNAILLSAPPDQMLLAQKIVNDLDRPRKTYRLTYTITEMDAGKRIGVQHFTMVVVSGQRTTLKQGSRVPIVTGTTNLGTPTAQQQVTYLDVGLNFDATLDESVNGVRLRTKAEQSSIAEGVSGLGLQDPVVRQTLLEGTSILNPGKPLVLGSVDVPGSTRHLDVEVVMEVVH